MQLPPIPSSDSGEGHKGVNVTSYPRCQYRRDIPCLCINPHCESCSSNPTFWQPELRLSQPQQSASN